MSKLYFLLIFTLWCAPAFSANCTEECADASECAEATCQVCIGHCVGCHALSDQTTCGDASTGADAACTWMTAENRCAYIGEVPEMDHTVRNLVFLCLAGLLVLWAVRRKIFSLPSR